MSKNNLAYLSIHSLILTAVPIRTFWLFTIFSLIFASIQILDSLFFFLHPGEQRWVNIFVCPSASNSPFGKGVLYQWQQNKKRPCLIMPMCMPWGLESKQRKPFYITCFIQKKTMGRHQTGFWGHLMSKSVRNGNTFFIGQGFPSSKRF